MFKNTPIFMRPYSPAVIDSILPQTAAAEVGLHKGDTLLAINGRNVASYNQFRDEIGRLSDVMASAKTHADSLKVRSITLVVSHPVACGADSAGLAAARDTLSAVLSEELMLGFTPVQIYKEKSFSYGLLESIPAGIGYGWHKLSSYVSDMQYVFTAEGAKSIGGFGAIGSLFPETWDWHRFWEMTAFLSIILAFMNILPIPALDGGHVLFLLYEMVFRRKPSEKFMIRAEYVGFGILILLMIVANLNDILRWLGYM
jgi:regulator of sigma E protease